MSEQQIYYWDCNEDTEYLIYDDMNEAIHHYLEENGYLDEAEIEVYGYTKQEVNREKFKKAILEYAHDYLGENYDGEDGHETPKEAIASVDFFVNSYLDNYTPWNCNRVKTVKVNIKEWKARNI